MNEYYNTTDARVATLQEDVQSLREQLQTVQLQLLKEMHQRYELQRVVELLGAHLGLDELE